MTTTKFLLTHLNCAACGKVSAIKIRAISGVTALRLEQSGNQAQGELDADREVTIEHIQQALIGTDYKVQAA